MKNIYLLYLLVFNPCFVNSKDLSFYKSFINQVNHAITSSAIWNLDTINIIGESDSIDRLGEAVSHGDYNGDGIDDLAIGIPNYDFQLFNITLNNTGTVLIIYGSISGLSTSNEQFLFQTFETEPPNLENLNGVEENDFFGKSLASGDFNCDGFTDLAVGTPEESVTFGGEDRNNVGAVNIFYGSDVGFADLGAGSTFLLQGTGLGIFFDGSISAGDRFGWSMTVGTFIDGAVGTNSCSDLAVSAPFEDFGISNSIADGGQVEVYYGSVIGLSGEPDFRDSLSQQSDDIPGSAAESGDQFGLSLAAGGFRLASNQFESLVVGIPGEDTDGISNSGAVQVFHSSITGLDQTNSSEIWSQSGTVIGIVEVNDRFGSSVAVGDFDHDTIDDLVIGVPREDINASGINDAGSINIIYGSTFGLSDATNQSFHQNTTNLLGTAENSDQFGDVLAVGDLNNDNFDDLVVGVPRENSSSGAFHVLYGSSDGVSTDNNQYHTNNFSPLDELGYAITIANFGNSPEIAVGIPGDDIFQGNNDVGSVEVFNFVLPELMFSDSFED